MSRPRIVCLCGSTRFIERIAVLAWEIEKTGAIALGLHLLPASYPNVRSDHQAEAEGVREKMDRLHLAKIDLADEVLVVNVGGYVGSSTTNEVRYARSKGKAVRWLEPDRVPAEFSEHQCAECGATYTEEGTVGCPSEDDDSPCRHCPRCGRPT